MGKFKAISAGLYLGIAAICLTASQPAKAVVVTQQIVNGGFETGNFSGWSGSLSTSNGWAVNNGTLNPAGPGGAVAPISGSFDARAVSGFTGNRFLTQFITLPTNLTSANVSWSDRIFRFNSNVGNDFSDPNQEYKVSLRQNNFSLISQLYSTNPGDPGNQPGPNNRSFNVTGLLQPFAGQTIRLDFENSQQCCFQNISVDNVSLVTQNAVAPVANANGPYVFDASTLSVNLDGTGSTDVDNGITSLQWDNINGSNVGSVGPNSVLPLSIQNSGLTMTTDAGTVELTVTDVDGLTDTATSGVSYLNAGPSVISKSGIEELDFSMSFAALFGDPDLAVNGLIAGFEELMVEISLSNTFGSGFLTGTGTSLNSNLSRTILDGIFGGPGTFSIFANVMDKAGSTASMGFDITLSVSEPGTLALLGLGLSGLGLARRRRII